MKLQAIYCINLASRPDRWQYVSKQAVQYLPGYELKRFEAIKASPGWIGCRESHLAVLALCRDLEQFMILEDDVQFMGDVPGVLSLAEQQLPDNWEMLYLGANFMSAKFNAPLQMYSRNLVKITQSYGSHAIVYNNRKGLVNEILGMAAGMRKIDVFFETYVQPSGHVFATVPMLATQSDSYSDITMKPTQYSRELVECFYKNIKCND